MTGDDAEAELGMIVGNAPFAHEGSWTAYIMGPEMALIYDEATGRIAQVTPAFLQWLAQARLPPGQTVTKILGLDDE